LRLALKATSGRLSLVLVVGGRRVDVDLVSLVVDPYVVMALLQAIRPPTSTVRTTGPPRW
jgi:hypothetical protein